MKTDVQGRTGCFISVNREKTFIVNCLEETEEDFILLLFACDDNGRTNFNQSRINFIRHTEDELRILQP